MIIMSINPTIVFTIIASLLVFEAVQANGDDFTVEQYLGVWYTIGATFSANPAHSVSCDVTNVTTRNDGDWTFNEVGQAIVDGQLHKSVGYGKVVNSKIYLVHPEQGFGETVSTVTVYNNGQDIILHTENIETHRYLLSRNIVVSSEAKKALERHAKDTGHYLVYFPNDNC